MYEVWVFTTAGAKAAYLQNAFNIRRKEKANAAPSLSFSLPADDPKVSFLTSAYEVKVRNTIKDRWEGLFTLDDATERWNSREKAVDVNYTGAMAQLGEEDNISYDTTSTPKTPAQIVTALLALQEKTPAITVGTIEPTTSFAFAVENTNLFTALLRCVEYLGGYIEVDADRKLNWYNEPGGDPVREIRYRKNLRGVTRKRNFMQIVNKLYAYGSGETEAQVTLIDAGEPNEYIENPASQAAYGIRIKRVTDKRIIHPSTLLLWAQKVLAQYKDPLYYYTVDVVNLAEHPDFSFDLEELAVGQIVRVVNSDLNNLNVNVKIVSVSTDLSRPENIQLELGNPTRTLSDTIGIVSGFKNIAENNAIAIGAGQVVVQGTFTVDGWRVSGKTTIDGGNIEANSISCNSLKTSTLTGKTITVDGATGILKSSNYVAGSAGWQIKGDGNAEFNNVTVRGNIATATLTTGSVLMVKGIIQSEYYNPGQSGWQITGAGSAFFGDLTTNVFVAGSVQSQYIYVTDGGTTNKGNFRTTNGYNLYWIDKDGFSHTIVSG
jgi:phage minor structural protein